MRPIVKGNYFQTETLPERVLAVLSHRPVLDDKRAMPNLGRNAMVKSPSLRCSELPATYPRHGDPHTRGFLCSKLPQLATLININATCDPTIIVGRALAERSRGDAVPVYVRGPGSDSPPPDRRPLSSVCTQTKGIKETAQRGGRAKAAIPHRT